jgi:predicted dehydrogenase
MGVAIVGCGFIGQKRSRALGGAKLVACFDVVAERASALAQESGAQVTATWREAIERPDVDAVVVATTHDALPQVGLAALEAGKHVLIEKPGARVAAELDPLIAAAARKGLVARVGFNHRYHPAFRKARELVDEGALGPLMYIRGRYGHGGRIGYDKEWRSVPALSGGGELIDQGMHLIDLSRWFLGDFSDVQGFAHTYFWDMPVEDNGFMLLRTKEQQVAFLHASWSEWKNLFSFEIFGKVGKLEISGLGGSYGLEKLTFYRMLPAMGPPETTVWEYPEKDGSWEAEFREFLDDIRLGRAPAASLADARGALEIVGRLYAGGSTGR